MSEFIEFLHEVFDQFGTISARKMFGGHGIYHDGLMFGLVADEVLYLKTDSQSLPLFEENGLQAFEFEKDGKVMKMSYYEAPEEIYDDSELASHWGQIAYDAALRANARKTRKKNKKKA